MSLLAIPRAALRRSQVGNDLLKRLERSARAQRRHIEAGVRNRRFQHATSSASGSRIAPGRGRQSKRIRPMSSRIHGSKNSQHGPRAAMVPTPVIRAGASGGNGGMCDIRQTDSRCKGRSAVDRLRGGLRLPRPSGDGPVMSRGEMPTLLAAFHTAKPRVLRDQRMPRQVQAQRPQDAD